MDSSDLFPEIPVFSSDVGIDTLISNLPNANDDDDGDVVDAKSGLSPNDDRATRGFAGGAGSASNNGAFAAPNNNDVSFGRSPPAYSEVNNANYFHAASASMGGGVNAASSSSAAMGGGIVPTSSGYFTFAAPITNGVGGGVVQPGGVIVSNSTVAASSATSAATAAATSSSTIATLPQSAIKDELDPLFEEEHGLHSLDRIDQLKHALMEVENTSGFAGAAGGAEEGAGASAVANATTNDAQLLFTTLNQAGFQGGGFSFLAVVKSTRP